MTSFNNDTLSILIIYIYSVYNMNATGQKAIIATKHIKITKAQDTIKNIIKAMESDVSRSCRIRSLHM